MNSLLYFVWNVDPTLVELGPLTVRWYGVLFAMAFFSGYYIIQWVLNRENKPKVWLDSLLIYCMVGTIAGARLGHVLFYQWDYYQNNLLEILQIWKGGLASHGAAIGIVMAMYLWTRKVKSGSLLWILDRVVIVVALSGLFIRGGNFMNHEIVGKETHTESGVKFMRNYDDITPNDVQRVTGMEVFGEVEIDRSKLNAAYDELLSNPKYESVIEQVPNRYPAQLYEAICYFIIFLILLGGYLFLGIGELRGMIFGLFLVLTFTARFVIEFLKEVQVDFEEGMLLDMGQWLSIPLVLLGLFFIGRSLRIKEKKTATDGGRAEG
ncbi:MAG: prolipoprotein diacylglyceryl transferase [Flavobacteriales bacterium]